VEGFPFIVLGIQIGKIMRKRSISRDFFERVGYIPLFNVSMNFLSKVLFLNKVHGWAKEICEKCDQNVKKKFALHACPRKSTMTSFKFTGRRNNLRGSINV
jgi:hypothetical protein